MDWSPDGEEILTGNGLIVNVSDGETHRVLPLGLSMRTVWSPDGSQMAVLTRAYNSLSQTGTVMTVVI